MKVTLFDFQEGALEELRVKLTVAPSAEFGGQSPGGVVFRAHRGGQDDRDDGAVRGHLLRSAGCRSAIECIDTLDIGHAGAERTGTAQERRPSRTEFGFGSW